MDSEPDGLRTWKIAIAEWIGLDPTRVIEIEVESYNDGTPETVHCRANIALKADPQRAVLRRTATDLGPNDPPFSTTWQLTDAQSAACLLAVGPKPA